MVAINERILQATRRSILPANLDAADGVEASLALRRLLERLGTPLVGHEVKPLLTMRFAEEPGAAPTHPDPDWNNRRLSRQASSERVP